MLDVGGGVYWQKRRDPLRSLVRVKSTGLSYGFSEVHQNFLSMLASILFRCKASKKHRGLGSLLLRKPELHHHLQDRQCNRIHKCGCTGRQRELYRQLSSKYLFGFDFLFLTSNLSLCAAWSATRLITLTGLRLLRGCYVERRSIGWPNLVVKSLNKLV